MRLEAFIRELLFDHDCVIVPGFGGLVANYRSARLNRITHIIRPPSKHVGYNRNLTHNDGLLANHVSRQLGLSYKEAMLQIEEVVAVWQHSLNSGERVAWDRIGIFFKDRSGVLQFIPGEQDNFLLESFGFSSIQLKPVVASIPVIGQDDGSTVSNDGKDKGIAWWKMAAAVAIPVAVASALLVIQPWKGKTDLAALNPFNLGNRPAQYEPRAAMPSFDSADSLEASGFAGALEKNSDERILFDFSTDKVSDTGIEVILAKADSTQVHIPTRKAPSDAPSKHRYAVIGGAFQIRENAEHFVNELRSKGYPAELAGRKGRLHLVAYGVYDQEAAARAALSEIRASGAQAWLRKP